MAEDPLIYEKLVDSLAPSLYGLREIKEAIILQLFGGVHQTLKDGTHFRGDIHILLIGDPASGKSQLLKLVPEIIPRGRYVSGKGVTGAGLTATVTKDEQFMGGWVLEAGALVLTNQGLLAIDEFEKMNVDDQIAMHEALEQGTISIAKASIVATLPAQTSVLAGGNPKFSRFDPYMPISKQITIPATLLSRFDLKFPMRDVPSDTDKLIVDHVLKTRESDFEGSIPKISSEFIRKYIAYAKRNYRPVLSKEAGKILRNFYIKTRKKAEGEGTAVPITLRQFEALIRLSEASAKVQLSQDVRKEDAQRAIKLMRYSLQQLGFDYETGQIDVDRSEGGVTSGERSKIRTVLDIISELSEKKKEILIDEISRRAKAEGIEEIDDILDKLKREGILFEPSPGFVQRV
jgi:replicative DNA helicase Mcm